MISSAWRLRGGQLGAALLLLILLGCALQAAASDLQAVEVVWRLVLDHGGELPGAVVGRACPTCPRGLLASRDLREGDLIVRVPLTLALRVNQHDLTDPLPLGENARDLLLRLHTDPRLNATWGPFLAALPGPDEVLSADSMSERHVAMLQHADLEEMVQYVQGQAEDAFEGRLSSQPEPAPPLAQLVPGATLATLRYVASLISTRTFSPVGSLQSPYFMPIIDLLNQGNPGNAHTDVSGADMVVHAEAPIAKGEEITLGLYVDRVTHRPDMALFIYGFVPAEVEGRPLLARVDLPDFTRFTAFDATPIDDSQYDDPEGGLATPEEHHRLASILASLPTSEAEDEALLASGAVTDWREQTILRFRVARKRALALTLERIQAAMATAASAAPCGSDGNECSDGEDSDPRQYEVGGGEAGGGAAAAAGGSREEL